MCEPISYKWVLVLNLMQHTPVPSLYSFNLWPLTLTFAASSIFIHHIPGGTLATHLTRQCWPSAPEPAIQLATGAPSSERTILCARASGRWGLIARWSGVRVAGSTTVAWSRWLLTTGYDWLLLTGADRSGLVALAVDVHGPLLQTTVDVGCWTTCGVWIIKY